MADAGNDGVDRDWHLDKKVPIALIGAIVLQAVIVGAWTTSISARVSATESKASELGVQMNANHNQLVGEVETLKTENGNTRVSLQKLSDQTDNITKILEHLERRAYPDDAGRR